MRFRCSITQKSTLHSQRCSSLQSASLDANALAIALLSTAQVETLYPSPESISAADSPHSLQSRASLTLRLLNRKLRKSEGRADSRGPYTWSTYAETLEASIAIGEGLVKNCNLGKGQRSCLVSECGVPRNPLQETTFLVHVVHSFLQVIGHGMLCLVLMWWVMAPGGKAGIYSTNR